MDSVSTLDRVSTTGGAVAAPPRRRKRAWSHEQSGWVGLLLAAPFIVMLAALVVYPFVQLFQAATGPPSGFGNFKAYFDNPANLTVLRITFIDSAYVTLISVFIGSIMAWSLRTTQSKAMRLLLLAGVFVPFWMGAVIKLYAFTIILERLGILNSTLQSLHLTSQPLSLLYTQFAVILGMVYQMLPYSVLPLYVAFLTIDLEYILAAESLGASRARALLSVVVPLSLPGILATVTITYVITLGFYLTPVILGGATAPFMASLISSDLFSFYDVADAAIAGIVLLIGAVVVVFLGYMLVGKERLKRAIA